MSSLVHLVYSFGLRTNIVSLSRMLDSMAHQVPKSVRVYSPSSAALRMAWKGKSFNMWYHGETGGAHGTCPTVAHK